MDSERSSHWISLFDAYCLSDTDFSETLMSGAESSRQPGGAFFISISALKKLSLPIRILDKDLYEAYT